MALQTSSARMACLFVPLWHFTRTIHISPYCTSIPVPFWHINYCAPTSTTHVRPLARLLRARLAILICPGLGAHTAHLIYHQHHVAFIVCTQHSATHMLSFVPTCRTQPSSATFNKTNTLNQQPYPTRLTTLLQRPVAMKIQ